MTETSPRTSRHRRSDGTAAPAERPPRLRRRPGTGRTDDTTARPGRRRLIVVSLAQVAVTVGLLAFVIWRWGPDPIVHAVSALPWWAFPIGIALGGAGVVAQALRWRTVARHHAIRIDTGPAIARCWQAAFLNSVLPGGLAGDLVRGADDSSDATVSAGRRALASAFAAIAAERLVGTAVVFAAATVALVPLSLPGAAVCLAIALAAVGVAWRWLRPLSAGELLRVVLLSIAGWAAFAGIFVVAMIALAPAAPLGQAPALASIAIAGMSVPIGVGGWGTREAAAAWAFGLAGLAPGLGVTVSVGYGILALCSTLPGAVVVAARFAPRVRELRRARSRRRARRAEIELRADVVAEREAADPAT
ncbi:lysylphosphatidylglycerol synthase transmembrane domain-containing protein [Microbacterium sp. Marseille-Q6648]|uniref:lysylphosphatidylglycerol synthase transmembrane domain-containing protein n=1 Tax=Microbacterium sp. Marseille-Q6648 TaxID=2937991 RepID=UPI00203ADD81|nr:lysylphosphatidylglycerol synthase transmembrane domain-containing protein [Microbacterium sp. Marseille-Q6648]